MDDNKECIRFKGEVVFTVVNDDGEVVREIQIDNIIVNDFLYQVLEALIGPTTANSIANYRYFGLGEHDAPASRTDSALGDEFDPADFGGVYSERVEGAYGADFDMRSYIVSGSIKNEGGETHNLNEAGLFSVDTVGTTGNMGARVAFANTVPLAPDETFNMKWIWRVSSA